MVDFEDAKRAFSIAKNISLSANTVDENLQGSKTEANIAIPGSLVSKCPEHIKEIIPQINGCYRNGWYDACAVLMRRLLETLIIECFESRGIDTKIKNGKGDFDVLAVLIQKTTKESSWNLGRNTKRSFPRIKQIGDLSAHNRRFIALKEDIDVLLTDFRIVFQELVFISIE